LEIAGKMAMTEVLAHSSELLAEGLAQPRRGKPAHHVDIAARCERHQDLHRPLRPGLRERGTGCRDQRNCNERIANGEQRIERAKRHFTTRHSLLDWPASRHSSR
jgi:hypothetical protein